MLSELGRDEDRCWSLGWRQRRMKQRPNLRMTQSPREVMFQPMVRTHGGYINTVALWRASRAHPWLLAQQLEPLGCASVPAAPLHLSPLGRPSPGAHPMPCWAPTPCLGGAEPMAAAELSDFTGARKRVAPVWDLMKFCFI